MRQEPVPVRGLILVLCAGLLLPAAGCVTGERRANAAWNRIGEGMSKDDVLGLAGEGDHIANADGTETWHYSYGSRPDPEQIGVTTGEVMLVLTVIGAYFVMIGAAGHGATPEPNFKLPEVDTPTVTTSRVHFKVVFGTDGRVESVTGLEACED
jgi:hypothetical protein